MQKITNFVKENTVGFSSSLALLLLIFVLPSLFAGNDTLLWLDRFLIGLIMVAYVGYRFIMFRKNNPNFKYAESTTVVSILGALSAVAIGLLFGLIIMLFVNPSNSLSAFFVILRGGFNNIKSFGNMFYFSVPIILTGLSVAFAFRTGLFNIGASGQFTVGAFTAIFIGVRWGALGDISPFLHWGIAVVGAAIAGGIWGAIPGFLKAYRNVNEVVTSIMLNYVAMYIVSSLISLYISAGNTFSRAVRSTAATPTLNLDVLFPGSSINAGIVVALVIALILHVVLSKTRFGYELKAVGYNRDAARYAGMNAKRLIVYSLMISGAVAGIGGAMGYLILGKTMSTAAILNPEGFTGIAISLLGLSQPIGVFIAGIFYGSLQQGGNLMQRYGMSEEIISIIIAVIIYASALALFLQKFVIRRLKSVERTAEEQIEEEKRGDE